MFGKEKKIMMDKINENELRKIIREEVMRLLETRGVSYDIKWLTNEIMNKFSQEYKNVIWEPRQFTYVKNGITYLHDYTIGFISIKNFMSLNSVNFTINNFSSVDEMRLSFPTVNYHSEYIPNANVINISCIAINNKVQSGYLRKCLSHELRHLFKYSFMNLNVNTLYYDARKIIEHPELGFKQSDSDIAWLLYWLSQDEILSNCQALYEEIITKKITNLDDVKSLTNVYSEFSEIKNLFKKLMQGNYDQTYSSYLFHNTSIEKIKKYIKEQYFYSEKKIDKVISEAFDELKRLNEGYRIISKIKDKLPIL